MNMTEIIIAGVFLLFILIREKQHQDEVKLLTKALIAKNVYELNEPKQEKGEEVTPPVEESDISDDKFMEEIRRQINRPSKADKAKEIIREKVEKIWPTK